MATLLALSCARNERRVLLLGFDGLDPEAVDLLISEGKLPNLARMRLEGAYGRVRSFEPMLSPILWTTIATAETYRRIGLELWKGERPDVELVYIEGTDSVAHLFGHLFRTKGLAGELAEQQIRYGRAAEAMYERADAILGDFLSAADSATTVIVLSDHGFRLGELPDDPSRLRDMRRVSERFHSPPLRPQRRKTACRAGSFMLSYQLFDLSEDIWHNSKEH